MSNFLNSSFFLSINENISNFWNVIDLKSNPFAILDIIIVSLLFYWIYLFLKETKAMRIVYGILFIGIIFLVGRLLNLEALNFLLKYAITGIAVAIPIVFQPELRSGLEKLGRAEIVSEFGKIRKTEMQSIIQEISDAVESLSKNKIGALIVIGRQTGLREYIESGVKINSNVLTQIIITIFTPKTPLHDGAIIIFGNKIVAAGCTLPLADIEYDYNLGTRHRAALGISMQTDALVVVVSEERGVISLASNGVLSQNLTSEKLQELLSKLLRQKTDKTVPKLKEQDTKKDKNA